MKKTFKLTHPKIKVARLVESIRHDIKKYIKRERTKTLPEGVDFWDFTCKYGHTVETAKVVHMAELSKCLDGVEKKEWESVYIEVIAKPGHRTKKKDSAGKFS